MTLTVRGIVIRVVPYHDYDKLVAILTEDHGKLFFKANAVRSLVNPNSAACNLFSYSEFVLQKKQDRYYVRKAQVLALPLGRNRDLSVLSAASYMAELCDDVGRDPEGAASAMRLLMNALVLLGKQDRPVELIKAVFELRLMAAIGFLPQLETCGACGTSVEEELSRFHLADGTVLCKNCAAFSDSRPISLAILKLMRRSVSVLEKEAYALRLDEELLQEFSRVCEQYVLAQLQRDFKTLDFYHRMKGIV